MSVLSVPEVFSSGNDQGGGKDGQSQGPERSSSLETKKSAGSLSLAASLPDNCLGEGSCRHQP